MREVKKEFPFTIIYETKESKAGKEYADFSIGYTYVVDKDAKNVSDRYKTVWFNHVMRTDVLKLSSIAENAFLTSGGNAGNSI